MKYRLLSKSKVQSMTLQLNFFTQRTSKWPYYRPDTIC